MAFVLSDENLGLDKPEPVWERAVDTFEYALQPIVSLQGGYCLGYEALLRGVQDAGFDTIASVFDAADAEGKLAWLDLMLQRKAADRFKQVGYGSHRRLFYNVDGRVFTSPDYSVDRMVSLYRELDIEHTSVCFELSENHRIPDMEDSQRLIRRLRDERFYVAIDDFGAGYSGLELLYRMEPDYIKIDRFFISGLPGSHRKQLYMRRVVSLAHTLGMTVIAEGVETHAECELCKLLGCDYVQGFYICPPTTDITAQERYDILGEIPQPVDADREHHLQEYVQDVETLCVDTAGISEVFEFFMRHPEQTFCPVLNRNNEPIGVIREKDIKNYAYSTFGRDLLKNRSSGITLQHFVTRNPVADITVDTNQLLEIFSMDTESEGIILTRSRKYAGFLSAQALLKLVYQRDLERAQDQNPLTGLPGNNRINTYLQNVLADTEQCYRLVYFDLNDFKPYNDLYGFRRGDRVIQLFGNILRAHCRGERFFVGHIGGDDFFVGWQEAEGESEDMQVIEAIQKQFQHEVTSLYEPQDRERGYVKATSRNGEHQKYPLLSASAAIAILMPNRSPTLLEAISDQLARLKKASKKNPDKRAVTVLD